MSQDYLYPCQHCDKSFPISVKQAGMEVGCPLCDKIVGLPGLRDIRSLPLHESDTTVSSTQARSESSSWLFSGGLLVSVVAGLLGLGLLNYANGLAMDSTLDLQLEYGRSQLDTLPAAQLWEAWDQLTRDGLPNWQETYEVRSNKQSNHYSYIAYGLFAISALGLFAMVGSFLASRKS